MLRLSDKEKAEFAMKMYEKAIEGYQSHWEHYTRWMNHFALFNGALFVGLYSTLDKKECSPLLQLFIYILGCISSWFWLFCARGFYRWLCSWIKTVQEHEKQIKEELFDGKVEVSVFVFNVFRAETDANFFKTCPFSAQKITQWFAGSVACAWSIITILFLVKNNSELGCQTIFVVVFILVTVIIAGCLWTCRESDLAESHLVV